MKSYGAYFFTLLAVLVWLYLGFIDPFFKTTNQKLLEEQYVYYSHEEDAVHWVSFDDVEIRKTDKHYVMTRPFKFLMTEKARGQLIEWSKLKFINRFTRDRFTHEELKELQLIPPLKEIYIGLGQQIVRLQIGKEIIKQNTKERYVMEHSSQKVYTVSSDWLEGVFSGAEHWIDTKPFEPFKSGPVLLELMNRDGKKLRLERTEQGVYIQNMNGTVWYGDHEKWDAFLTYLCDTHYPNSHFFKESWHAVYGDAKPAFQINIKNEDVQLQMFIGEKNASQEVGVLIAGHESLYMGINGYDTLVSFEFEAYVSPSVIDAPLTEIKSATFTCKEGIYKTGNTMTVTLNSMHDMRLGIDHFWVYESGKILNKMLSLMLSKGNILSDQIELAENKKVLDMTLHWKDSDRKDILDFFQIDHSWYVKRHGFNTVFKMDKAPDIAWINEPYALLVKKPFAHILDRSQEVFLDETLFAEKNSLGNWMFFKNPDMPLDVEHFISNFAEVECYHSSAYNAGVDFGFGQESKTLTFKGKDMHMVCQIGSFSNEKESFWLIDHQQMWFCRKTDFLLTLLKPHTIIDESQKGDTENAHI